MNKQLFEGKLVRLAAPDVERDAATESEWTHNANFVRLMYAEPLHPLSPKAMTSKHEAEDKDPRRNQFFYTIRTLADDRLIGLARLFRIEWNNGTGRILLGIADENERGKGYGTDALNLLLNFTFNELNLYRVSANVVAYNEPALAFLQKNNFAIEVRRREALCRDGKRWDIVMLGLLREDWSGK